ncbi:ATP-dependent DNA helicase [Halomonas sp. McH1-25]|uniref:ATP-dependent DNA helicase n=1 Tax=unclassified Halomonas TaxID=2609666 RepID=UPI001EF404B9|nr:MULTISPECIES: ATP-dependent DNA helicase [unclassified Halomonas]MCG7601232.1 ATP-dependent DNA helicase [Halomonas sp. McH1-25]MCP1343690.1 ATP-dependent DNA helicase [Halomonas sp. FL8]MCP1362120.1 ATP-dependent DNA helicase [Halomonas sp. BBD45]
MTESTRQAGEVDNTPAYSVAVRSLCEFTAKAGDLDLRFTPSPSALEGIAGHAVVAARRSAGYQREIALNGEYGQLRIRGRADGYDPERNQLEEIKTFRGDLERMPANHRALHWAQAKVYGALLCRERDLSEVRLALVYFDIVSQREHVLSEMHDAASLQAFFIDQCQRFLAWAGQERSHRQVRDQALGTLRFPYPDFRRGQRSLAETVYKAASTGRCLMAQAPTGIGKTLGTLFPLLKAMPGQQLDRIFFLAAKTPGRQLALQALTTLTAPQPDREALPLRVLELTARDKACEHPDKACHGESCPLASGFYDRLPKARQAAVERGTLDRAALRDVALSHGICPYYLGQEMARWSDVVVGDYHYYFDFHAMLYALTVANQWRVGVLVDEAHNLVERARGMYTAQLDQTAVKAVRRDAPSALGKALTRVDRQWRTLNDGQSIQDVSSPRPGDEGYRVLAELPGKLVTALQQAVAAITDYLTEQPDGLDAALQTFYFEAMQLCRIAETFDSHSLCDLTLRPGRRGSCVSTLCLRNVVPAGFLAPRFDASHTSVLFSATLSPELYYRDLLGLPAQTAWLETPSPFSAEQVTLQIVDRISTRYSHRAASLEPIVEIVAEQYAALPGNYLVFLSSFEYLEQVAARFQARHPDIPCWQQARRMDEAARQGFLDRFIARGQGIGFAVLGGAFGEGIDLPGDRLIGAFIATLGLPQLNPVNEQFRQRLATQFGAGYEYAYLYPGLQKVIQAAGRVIRTEQDRGVITLIDDRFAQPRIRRLLPGWWTGLKLP